MPEKYDNENVEFTQRVQINNQKKKKTYRSLLFSLSLITGFTALAVVLVYIISLAKDSL